MMKLCPICGKEIYKRDIEIHMPKCMDCRDREAFEGFVKTSKHPLAEGLMALRTEEGEEFQPVTREHLNDRREYRKDRAFAGCGGLTKNQR